MKLIIHRIGRTRERWWQEAEADYLRRLTGTWQVVLREYKSVDVTDQSQIEEARRDEGLRLTKALAPRSRVVAMDERGHQLNSVEWASELARLLVEGGGEVEFLIGGAFGLDERVRNRADRVWALSSLTFPHQMARLILIEQLYRARMILQNSPYHK
jgi:23S rRNA (pseudouridine1915-N3)-methyltransferase